MLKTGVSVYEAVEKLVNGMNAVPTNMIEKLWYVDPNDWKEVTMPVVGDCVNVSVVDGDPFGEVVSCDYENDSYTIDLDSGLTVVVSSDKFEICYFEKIPAYDTMWSFNSDFDNAWLDNGGIWVMSELGFRIYESSEFGYYFGFGGTVRDQYEEYWLPLYKRKDLQWLPLYKGRDSQ